MSRPAAPKLAAVAMDEAVAEILEDATRRRDEMALSARERKLLQDARRREQARAEKARAKAASQADQRTFLLLPAALKAKVEALALGHGVPVSQVVAFLLFVALERLEDGEVDFGPYLEPSYSPKFDFELVHPADFERVNRRVEKLRSKGRRV